MSILVPYLDCETNNLPNQYLSTLTIPISVCYYLVLAVQYRLLKISIFTN